MLLPYNENQIVYNIKNVRQNDLNYYMNDKIEGILLEPHGTTRAEA